MKKFKLCLRNFSGKVSRFFKVSQTALDVSKVTLKPALAHHKIIVDRSGSMYRDMETLRQTLLKVLTLEEYRDSKLLVDLWSYSSSGDLTCHFEKVSVSDVMSPNSMYQKQINSLRVTGLTCISQSLFAVAETCDPDTFTAISLHSDGYANDRSPMDERRKIDQALSLLMEKNVFVNTVAYSRYSDFSLLNTIANKMSGVCVQANTAKEVFDALHRTSEMLVNNTVPLVEVPLDGADFVVVFAPDDHKVVGGVEDLQVRGLTNGGTILRYQEVDEKTFNSYAVPNVIDLGDPIPALLYAKVQLALGNINRAKYGLVSTRNATLIERHAKALSGEELASFASDLDTALFTDVMNTHTFWDTDKGLGGEGNSVLEVAHALHENRSHIQVNVATLNKVYSRRSLKRVPGIGKKGTLEVDPVPYETRRLKTAGGFSPLVRFDMNRTGATINMLVSMPIELVKKEDNSVVQEVAGVRLDNLRDYRNYTLVGDGVLNIPSLEIQVTSKKAFRSLVNAGVVTGDYDPEGSYEVNFSSLPLVSYQQDFRDLEGVPDSLLSLEAVLKFISANLKGKSERLTQEQIQALGEVFVTPNLNVSFPTVYQYVSEGLSKEEALNVGKVDSGIRYQIRLGNEISLGTGQLPSANKFLADYYEVSVKGAEVKKPTFDLFFDSGVSFSRKALSSRKKVTALDLVLLEIFDDLLGVQNTKTVAGLLESHEMKDLIPGFEMLANRNWDNVDEAVEFLSLAKRSFEQAIDRLYRAKVMPLVFYVGSTGLLPDDMETPALTKDEVVQRFPQIKVGKKEDDASFFVLNDHVVLSVYAESSFFTPSVSA